MTTLTLVLSAALIAAPRPNLAAVRLESMVDRRSLAVRDTVGGVQGRFRAWSRLSAQRALIGPGRVVAATALCSVGGLIVIGLRPAAALALGLAGAVALRTGLRSIASRGARRDHDSLLHALTILEAELVAGSREDAALGAAAAVAGRTGSLLREAAARAGFGDDVAGVLERSELLVQLGAAWRVRRACGAPLADVVAQVSLDGQLRRRRSMAVATALAGPRSSSALLATLPILGIGLGTVMGAQPLSFLFGSADGSFVLLVGVALDVLGWLWTGAMTQRAEA